MANTKKVSKPEVKAEAQDRFTWDKGDVVITPPSKPQKPKEIKRVVTKTS